VDPGGGPVRGGGTGIGSVIVEGQVRDRAGVDGRLRISLARTDRGAGITDLESSGALRIVRPFPFEGVGSSCRSSRWAPAFWPETATGWRSTWARALELWCCTSPQAGCTGWPRAEKPASTCGSSWRRTESWSTTRAWGSRIPTRRSTSAPKCSSPLAPASAGSRSGPRAERRGAPSVPRASDGDRHLRGRRSGIPGCAGPGSRTGPTGGRGPAGRGAVRGERVLAIGDADPEFWEDAGSVPSWRDARALGTFTSEPLGGTGSPSDRNSWPCCAPGAHGGALPRFRGPDTGAGGARGAAPTHCLSRRRLCKERLGGVSCRRDSDRLLAQVDAPGERGEVLQGPQGVGPQAVPRSRRFGLGRVRLECTGPGLKRGKHAYASPGPIPAPLQRGGENPWAAATVPGRFMRHGNLDSLRGCPYDARGPRPDARPGASPRVCFPAFPPAQVVRRSRHQGGQGRVAGEPVRGRGGNRTL